MAAAGAIVIVPSHLLGSVATLRRGVWPIAGVSAAASRASTSIFVVMLLASCVTDADDASRQVIEQPFQFRVEVPAGLSILLPQPNWVLDVAEARDPPPPPLLFEFVASSLDGSFNFSVVGVYGRGEGIDLAASLHERVELRPEARAEVVEERHGSLTTLTLTAGPEDFAVPGGFDGFGVAVAVADSSRPSDAWLLFCTGDELALVTAECAMIIDSFTVLQRPGTP